MVETIEAVQGRASAVALVTSPERFLPTYRAAAPEGNARSLSAKTVEVVCESVSTVDP
ncbi:MAG: hypothetical protein ACI9YT_001295 [Halobacteriales archaeon]|jgi:hypothetical protein